MIMVDGHAGQGRDHRVSDGGCVERVRIANRKQQARNSGQGRDVSCAHDFNSNMRVWSGVA